MLHMMEKALVWLFPLSEAGLLLFRRSRGLGAASKDQGSMVMLWAVMLAGLAGAIALAPFQVAPLPFPAKVRDGLIVAVMVGGMLLRWAAIRTLGRFFTVDVAIHPEQQVIRTGPYAWVRHPSYTGLLLLWLGVGLGFRSGLCLLVLMVPVVAALWRRILMEEAALRLALGGAYEDYCRTTRRLVPGLL